MRWTRWADRRKRSRRGGSGARRGVACSRSPWPVERGALERFLSGPAPGSRESRYSFFPLGEPACFFFDNGKEKRKKKTKTDFQLAFFSPSFSLFLLSSLSYATAAGASADASCESESTQIIRMIELLLIGSRGRAAAAFASSPTGGAGGARA